MRPCPTIRKRENSDIFKDIRFYSLKVKIFIFVNIKQFSKPNILKYKKSVIKMSSN
jgi:hypothetical protein